ncbi:AcrR family transcriptional regulator [Nonomuraea thailandensis]|uniref:AcrR family transcriptional regulator n=1 Tax=Nonomuraea thailandensis TaxID=1188745 RepID=A0A9X2GLP1_9ACTN|nr:TetR/AcrR family transcriptional regulator [Nonomuraea thailandensis]MCP2359997.1 AcrR family transcriptional regulator [Nonomuraea thailandensis]
MTARRRQVEVDQAILEAAYGELLDRGYAGVTYDGVARRAETSKPVLYRRYPTRASLIFASLRRRLGAVQPPPATGNLRGDLIAWLDAAQARAAEIGGRTYRALLGEADDDLLDAIGALIGMASGDLERHVIEPARARGELGPEPLVAEIAAMPVILLRDRIVFGTATATDVAEIVDRICLPLFRGCDDGRPASAPAESATQEAQ